MRITLALALTTSCLAFLAGCSTPSINLATNEPIKVDITMRVDVHQFSEGGPVVQNSNSRNATPGEAAVSNSPAASGSTPEERRKNRQADVQVFKNSRLVGEGRDGLLSIREEIEGDYGDYLRSIVERENSDRMQEMKASSEAEKRPLKDIQADQGRLWANRSFKGEWIEQSTPGGEYTWIQKSE